MTELPALFWLTAMLLIYACYQGWCRWLEHKGKR